MKNYTTGQVAKICSVSARTVQMWFDKNFIEGYRIPGSRDRRIPHKNLVEFLKKHNIPLGDLEDSTS